MHKLKKKPFHQSMWASSSRILLNRKINRDHLCRNRGIKECRINKHSNNDRFEKARRMFHIEKHSKNECLFLCQICCEPTQMHFRCKDNEEMEKQSQIHHTYDGYVTHNFHSIYLVPSS